MNPDFIQVIATDETYHNFPHTNHKKAPTVTQAKIKCL